MNLSDEQNKAIKKILNWISNVNVKTKQIMTLAGVSGSGKSTLIQYIKNELDIKTMEMVYTGIIRPRNN